MEQKLDIKKGENLDRGVFFDRNHQPTTAELQQVLGDCLLVWEKLGLFIESHPKIEKKWSAFGPVGFGCGYRYRHKGKALIALYPQRDQVIAQVVLGKTQAEQALNLEFRALINKIIRDAPQGHDGRWLSIPVLDSQDVEAVKKLIQLKLHPIRKDGDK